jgi:hypothetical protein
MPFPEYVPTRVISVGGAMVLESADLLKVRVTVTGSRSLIWDATGYRFENLRVAATSAEGSEVQIVLPRTDVQGWKDARTGAIIDVSAPDAYSHRYTALVEFLTSDNRAAGIPPVTLGPFVLPAGDGVVDLDKTVPASSTAGDVVSVPDFWGTLVAEAQAAASEAAAALVDSDSFIASRITTPGTQTEQAFSSAIVASVAPAAATAVDAAVAATDWGTVVAESSGLFVPAMEFATVAGTPTLNTTSHGLPMWLMSPNATQVVGCSINLGQRTPTLVDIDIEWTNVSAVAGTVQLQLRWAAVGEGTNLSSLNESASTKTLLLTAPAQRRVRRTNIASAVTIPPGATRFTVRTTGVGSLGANQIGLIKVIVRPVARLAANRRQESPLPGTLDNTYNNNAGAFIRDNVVTVGDNQYAVWVDNARKPIIGKRVRTAGTWGAWSTFDLSTISGNPLGSPVDPDGHNTFSIGVDGEGRIHVSGDHHDDPLKIVRSNAAHNITAWSVPDVSGIPSANRNSITYPQFLKSPLDGSLWLVRKRCVLHQPMELHQPAVGAHLPPHLRLHRGRGRAERVALRQHPGHRPGWEVAPVLHVARNRRPRHHARLRLHPQHRRLRYGVDHRRRNRRPGDHPAAAHCTVHRYRVLRPDQPVWGGGRFVQPPALGYVGAFARDERAVDPPSLLVGWCPLAPG